MKVLCEHKMNTTKFLCKDPDTGQRIYINVNAFSPVLIDERIANKYPSTFTKIDTVEAAPAQVEEVKPEPDDATDELEIIEPEATEVVEEEPFAVNLVDADIDADIVAEVIDQAEEEEDLCATIDAFKTKKKLAAYCKVELKSKTLKAMKAELKELWKI